MTKKSVSGKATFQRLVWSADADEEADWRFLYGVFYQRVGHCLTRGNQH